MAPNDITRKIYNTLMDEVQRDQFRRWDANCVVVGSSWITMNYEGHDVLIQVTVGDNPS